MYMEGTKETLYHPGMRPRSPRITPNERFAEVKPELAKIEKLPNAKPSGFGSDQLPEHHLAEASTTSGWDRRRESQTESRWLR